MIILMISLFHMRSNADLACDSVCLHFPNYWTPLPLLRVCLRAPLPTTNNPDECFCLNIWLEYWSLWSLLHWTWHRFHAGSGCYWQYQRPRYGKAHKKQQQCPYARGQTKSLRLLLILNPFVVLLVRMVSRGTRILARTHNWASMFWAGNDWHFSPHPNVFDRCFPRKCSNGHRRIGIFEKRGRRFPTSGWPNSL